MTAEDKIQEIQDMLRPDAAINELKAKRDRGEITPEVLEMCKHHVDQMLESVKKKNILDSTAKELDLAVEQLKNDQELLVAMSELADKYEEIVAWNKLLNDKTIAHDVTRLTAQRREATKALHAKIRNMVDARKLSIKIHTLVFAYGYRNYE